MSWLTGTEIPSDRPPRVLWANAFCLLDTSSGASMSARDILVQLDSAGVEVKILGATIFDHIDGAGPLNSELAQWQAHPGNSVRVRDQVLRHELITTASTRRDAMTAIETNAWSMTYQKLLDEFQPDLVFGYGGRDLEMFASSEARLRGIPYMTYLVNRNYAGSRWARDVRMVLTDSEATAAYYQERLPCPIVALGKFIARQQVVPTVHRRERLLFVNPSWSKGAGIVAQLAILMERIRPDICFEVVESRGQWADVLAAVCDAMGVERRSLSNVIVTPHTDDMRPVYGRARLLLALSLWAESGPRVIAEAMLNGIPAVVTNLAGNPEMMGDGGIRVTLPSQCHEPPFNRLPSSESHAELIQRLIRLYDDEAAYQALVRKAHEVGRHKHELSVSRQRLLEALMPLFRARAGDHVRPPEPVGQKPL